ncbi:MAG: acetate--CoA ligase family protein [Candidatus Aenigmatarchaeota archaeon]|nr:MAG: acetate--CoA ligase family protein [Candidatus Aenigmarchaeota archaeon]
MAVLSFEDARKPLVSGPSKVLTFEDSQVLAKKYRIRTPRYGIARTPVELSRVLGRYKYPVVMKLVSPDVVHKSDVGGVVMDVRSEADAHKAFEKFWTICRKRRFTFRGALVQEQVEGTYVLVGLKRDPQFGPVVAFGLGGVFVEIMKDVTFRVCPVSDKDADEMVKEIKGYPILAGARGSERVDMKAIRQAIKAVSAIGMRENVRELDLNPLVVSKKGAWAVDVRVVT